MATRKYLPALLMGMAVSTATMAAYGPMPTHRVNAGAWSLSAGYGQTFDHDNGFYGDTPAGESQRIVNNLTMDHVKLYEVDLFHHSGFGAVLMGAAKKAKITQQSNSTSTDFARYTFRALMLGYKMNINKAFTARIAVGQADQKYTFVASGVDHKLNGKMAANLEAKFHFKMSKNMTAFVAGGYLNLEDIHKAINADTLKMDPSAGYVKVGLRFAM